jgi:hypothetical protein
MQGKQLLAIQPIARMLTVNAEIMGTSSHVLRR